MKRGTPDHPKTRQLAVLLHLKRYEVVGLLESLWHFTASYAKRGDLGRWSDAAIAAALEWDGEEAALIDALVQAGFLDRDRHYRLLVHDWADHSDQTVSRSEEVKKHGFAEPTPDDPSEMPPETSEEGENASGALGNASQPKPKPKPLAEAKAEAVPPPEGGKSNASPAASSAPAPEKDGTDSSSTNPSQAQNTSPSPPSAAGEAKNTGVFPKLPTPDSFATTVAVKLRLADVGLSEQGQHDQRCFARFYARHVIPGHLGPPKKAVSLCFNSARQIGEERKIKNKAAAFVGRMKTHLAEAGFDWDGE